MIKKPTLTKRKFQATELCNFKFVDYIEQPAWDHCDGVAFYALISLRAIVGSMCEDARGITYQTLKKPPHVKTDRAVQNRYPLSTF